MKEKSDLYFSIQEFYEKYTNDDDCLQEIFTQRYGHYPQCTHCGKKFKYYKVKHRKSYVCAYCGYQIYPLAGTIFHKSSTSLQGWFLVIFWFSMTNKKISIREVEKSIMVSYKCAHRIVSHVRKLLEEDPTIQSILES